MITTTRTLTLSTLLAMFFALILVHQADAEGRFRPRVYNESTRQQAKESCRINGGTSFETTYHYSYGSDYPTSVTTTCHGGDDDGLTCPIGGGPSDFYDIYDSGQCTRPLYPGVETGPFGGVSDDSVIEDFDTSSSSETADTSGDVLATPEADTAPRTGIVSTGRSAVVQAEEDDKEP